jgi:hypothetical protein
VRGAARHGRSRGCARAAKPRPRSRGGRGHSGGGVHSFSFGVGAVCGAQYRFVGGGAKRGKAGFGRGGWPHGARGACGGGRGAPAGRGARRGERVVSVWWRPPPARRANGRARAPTGPRACTLPLGSAWRRRRREVERREPGPPRAAAAPTLRPCAVRPWGWGSCPLLCKCDVKTAAALYCCRRAWEGYIKKGVCAGPRRRRRAAYWGCKRGLATADEACRQQARMRRNRGAAGMRLRGRRGAAAVENKKGRLVSGAGLILWGGVGWCRGVARVLHGKLRRRGRGGLGPAGAAGGRAGRWGGIAGCGGFLLAGKRPEKKAAAALARTRGAAVWCGKQS